VNKDLAEKICNDEIGNALKILKIGSIVVGHTPQFNINNGEIGINGTCINTAPDALVKNSVVRVDVGSSKAFNSVTKHLGNGKITNNSPQALEIKKNPDKTYTHNVYIRGIRGKQKIKI